MRLKNQNKFTTLESLKTGWPKKFHEQENNSINSLIFQKNKFIIDVKAKRLGCKFDQPVVFPKMYLL